MKSLEDKVSSAYVKYQSAMKGGGGAEGGASEGSGLSALPLLPVNDQFTLNKDEAWYTLILETQVSINLVHTVYALFLSLFRFHWILYYYSVMYLLTYKRLRRVLLL